MKKNYTYIILGILLLIIVGIIIYFNKENKTNWTKDFLNTTYNINYLDCNNNNKTLDNNILNKIDNGWSKLSNNGPWTGNNNVCYDKITITTSNKSAELLIIDESSLVLKIDNNETYYTNAGNLITYLKEN